MYMITLQKFISDAVLLCSCPIFHKPTGRLVCIMDIGRNSSTSNHICGLDMTMEGVILQDQFDPYDLVNPSYPLQTHHPLIISGFPSENQLGSQREEQEEEPEEESLGAMKEMMYKIAAMQPVDIDPATIQKPKRRNVRISNDPESVAARHRRGRISEKIRILQRLVPGGAKMDTATMLDEAIRYVKFLKRQVHELQANQSMPPPWHTGGVSRHFSETDCRVMSNERQVHEVLANQSMPPPWHTGGVSGHFSETDCPVMSNDTLGITSSSTQLAGEAGRFTIGGTGDIRPCDTLCFNHSEVIRINDLISDYHASL